MKRIIFFLVFCAAAPSVFAQRTHVWKGGKPGRSNDWHCAANWNNHRVPDEFSDVLIPRMLQESDNPVISDEGVEVNSMRICEGARLTVGNEGSLSILNPDYCIDVSRITVLGRLILPGWPLKYPEQEVLAKSDLRM